MHSMPPCLRQICGGLILVCGLIRQHSIRIDALYTYRHIGIRHIFYFYRRVGVDIYFIFMRWIIYIYMGNQISFCIFGYLCRVSFESFTLCALSL